MNARVKKVLVEALELPREDRAALVRDVLATLGDEDSVHVGAIGRDASGRVEIADQDERKTRFRRRHRKHITGERILRLERGRRSSDNALMTCLPDATLAPMRARFSQSFANAFVVNETRERGATIGG